MEGWPDSEARDRYLRDLRRLRDAMIHSKIGYIGYAGGAILGALRSRYPKAHDVFRKEQRRGHSHYCGNEASISWAFY